jgi:hypothetical protein
MLLEIYELIKKLESEIGNEATVRLSAGEGTFIVRVDWGDDDFHAMHHFSEIELAQIVDDNIPLNYFVEYCKKEYARKKKERGLTP